METSTQLLSPLSFYFLAKTYAYIWVFLIYVFTFLFLYLLLSAPSHRCGESFSLVAAAGGYSLVAVYRLPVAEN